MLKCQYQYDAVGLLSDTQDTRLGHLAYRYDPVGNLLDDKTQELNRPLESNPRRNKLMDNLLREYAGTHYQYHERGNLVHRLHNGEHSRLSWDLFDRLSRFDDSKLSVVYSYDALGRRLHKHSTAHHQDDPRAGSGWNQMQRAKRQRELG